MQKLMKNWIFTMITCILLSVLAVLMFLDGFGVGDLYIGQAIIHILTAVVLLLYIIFALIPLVPRYRHGGVRAFLILEIFVLLLTAFAQAFSNAVSIPFFSTMQACSVVGLALWLHCSMQLIRAYLVKGVKEHRQVPLWLFCLYILLGAAGVWQMVKPLIANRYFIFGIAVLALVFAIIFGVFTVQNRKALPKKPKKEKKKNKKNKTDAPSTENATAPAAELPEAAGKQEKAVVSAQNNKK
ncbi:MAG: hypothetical protein IJX39_02375 [Clostridia bacterium]|nr:hypothetical protein [Clostridia bacterium]